MIPEIWSVTDRIFCHYGPFFAQVSLPNGPSKIKFWKNEKKTLKDIIILQRFTINDSHMIYAFSDMERNRQNFLSFWTIFCPFIGGKKSKFWKTEKRPWRYHHFTQVYQKSWSYAILFLRQACNGCNYFSFWANKKSKFRKSERNPWRYHHFTIVHQKPWSYCYTVPEIWYMTDVITFLFWAIFCPFTPLTAQNIKILTKWKKHLGITSFYICVPKIIMIRWCMVSEIWCMTDVIVISHFGLFFALLLL